MNTIKIMTLLFSLICFSFAGKGNIQFTLDQEKYDLPLDRVIVRVENNILISLRAEINNEKEMKLVNLEFALNSFSDTRTLTEFTQLEIRAKKVKSSKETRVLISGEQATTGSLPDTLQGTSAIILQKSIFRNGHLEIEGTFNLEYKSEKKQEITVNDGRFTIII